MWNFCFPGIVFFVLSTSVLLQFMSQLVWYGKKLDLLQFYQNYPDCNEQCLYFVKETEDWQLFQKARTVNMAGTSVRMTDRMVWCVRFLTKSDSMQQKESDVCVVQDFQSWDQLWTVPPVMKRASSSASVTAEIFQSEEIFPRTVKGDCLSTEELMAGKNYSDDGFRQKRQPENRKI